MKPNKKTHSLLVRVLYIFGTTGGYLVALVDEIDKQCANEILVNNFFFSCYLILVNVTNFFFKEEKSNIDKICFIIIPLLVIKVKYLNHNT